MYKQNNVALLPVIQKVGCFFISCCKIAEMIAGKELEIYQINQLWNICKENGNINVNNEVRRSAPIMNKALKMLNCKGHFIEVGTKRNGVVKFYESITDNLKEKTKYFIQKIGTDSLYGTHFRVVDCKEKVIFDPYYPDVKETSIYYTIVYAYEV